MRLQTGAILVPGDIGLEFPSSQVEQLADHLESQLNQPIVVAQTSDGAHGVDMAIRSLIDLRKQILTIVPLGISPISNFGAVPRAISAARLNSPTLDVRIASPLTWTEWAAGWFQPILDELTSQNLNPTETAVLVVGRSTTDSLKNANVARLAHLISEQLPVSIVSYALINSAKPTIADSMDFLAKAGYRQVILIPWLLSREEFSQSCAKEFATIGVSLGIGLIPVTPSLLHPEILESLVTKCYCARPDYEVRPTAVSDLGMSPDSLQATPINSSAFQSVTVQDALALRELEQQVNKLLPPEYQGRYEDVRSQSMGSAGLKLNAEGKVAWDQIWTSFCDLALAGGPPHRGSLLEAVTAEEALAETGQYDAVVAEIERGISLVTGLPLVKSRAPGWVGVRCHSEEMATWLLRAIIVENIMVRREADTLYLPAGPRFTLKREIRNVITAVAKTVHYWKAHLCVKSH